MPRGQTQNNLLEQIWLPIVHLREGCLPACKRALNLPQEPEARADIMRLLSPSTSSDLTFL